MKLKLLKKVGLLAAGETHSTSTDEQGKSLIKRGLAEPSDEPDEEPVILKRELYKDEVGNYRTREVPIEEGEDHLAIPQQGQGIQTISTLTPTQSVPTDIKQSKKDTKTKSQDEK